MFRRTALAVLPAVLLASLVVALTSQLGLDYYMDAGRGIQALGGGHLHQWAARQPQMGQLSILLRAPVEALGLSELWTYRLGALVLLAGPMALTVALWHGPRPREMHLLVLVAVLCLNPITFRALDLGHPEEPLGGALCALAILLALDGRARWAGLCLGLALATKQWAIFAVLPVLFACTSGDERARLLRVAVPVAAVLVLPPIVVDPHAFLVSMSRPVSGLSIMRPANFWSLAVPPRHFADIGGEVVALAVVPPWLRSLAHPLVVGVGLLLALGWRARRQVAVGPETALALLALVFLMRCLLDPWNHGYYHWPFLAALACWEVRGCLRVPVVTAVSSAVVWIVFVRMHGMAQDATYVLWAVACGGLLIHDAFRPALPAWSRRVAAAAVR